MLQRSTPIRPSIHGTLHMSTLTPLSGIGQGCSSLKLCDQPLFLQSAVDSSTIYLDLWCFWETQSRAVWIGLNELSSVIPTHTHKHIQPAKEQWSEWKHSFVTTVRLTAVVGSFECINSGAEHYQCQGYGYLFCLLETCRFFCSFWRAVLNEKKKTWYLK